MKKKLLISLVILLVVLTLISCGDFKHEHTWIEATCTTPKTCSICNKTEGDPLEHTRIDLQWVYTKYPTFTETGKANLICNECDIIIEQKELPFASQGLKYMKVPLNEITRDEADMDVFGYLVFGQGTCTDDVIVIPEEYEGLPVWGIGFILPTANFSDCKFSDTVVEIILPKTTKMIGGTLRGLDSLEEVIIPEGVEHIGMFAFNDCTSLKTILIPDSVVHMDEVNGAFYGCSSLSLFKIGSGITSLGNVFGKCSSLTSVVVPENVTELSATFQDCSNLTSVTLNNTLERIGARTFYNCTQLTNITFEGTIEEWNAIEKVKNWGGNTGDYMIYCTDGTIAKDGTITYK